MELPNYFAYIVLFIATVAIAYLLVNDFLSNQLAPEEKLANFISMNLNSEFTQNMTVTKVNSSLYFAQWDVNDSRMVNQTRFGAYLSNPGTQPVYQIFVLTPTNSVNESFALLDVYFTTADVHNTDWKCAYLDSIGGYLTCQRSDNDISSKTYWSVVISNYTRFTICKEPKDSKQC
ncbi:MAG: hypothetical protein HYW22_00730 [Candidatus Aenigmarchaeota archaeon]|nr:hypothetical protein [Candidatus Aenigmarchaeota archaeon]